MEKPALSDRAEIAALLELVAEQARAYLEGLDERPVRSPGPRARSAGRCRRPESARGRP